MGPYPIYDSNGKFNHTNYTNNTLVQQANQQTLLNQNSSSDEFNPWALVLATILVIVLYIIFK